LCYVSSKLLPSGLGLVGATLMALASLHPRTMPDAQPDANSSLVCLAFLAPTLRLQSCITCSPWGPPVRLLSEKHGFFFRQLLQKYKYLLFNSLTAKCIPAGTKNSLSEDFLLASHKHPHHDEPFPPSSAMVLMEEHTPPREPLCKGLDEATVEGFYQNQ
jgi:hypothetical protein